MSDRIIECISLYKEYISKKQKADALIDINLFINKNETVLLKGRSGAGKSTLMNLMC